MANTTTPKSPKKPADRKKKATSPTTSIVIGEDASAPEGLPVTLVHEVYTVFPQKTLHSMDMADMASAMRGMKTKAEDMTDDEKFENAEKTREMVQGVLNWVGTSFPEEDSARIFERLRDTRDALEMRHVLQLMNAVREHFTEEANGGRPSM